jgi:reactive intermediate/imine deaminase
MLVSMTKSRLLIVPLTLLSATLGAERRAIVPDSGPKPVGPYSPGIEANGFVYVSGQGMRRPDNTTPDSNEERVRQCLENVEAILRAAGLTMEHVVYSQVYLHESMPYEVMDKVWQEVFARNPPARAVLGVYRMPTDTTVEINAVAVRDLKRKRILYLPERATPVPAAVWGGDRLYLSGVYGATTQEALDQMKQALAAARLDFRHMVFVNPYLTSTVSMSEMNETYARHFEFGNTPARATIRVAFLPGGAAISFTGVAVRNLKQRRAVRPKNMRPSPTASPCVWAGDTYYCSAKAGFIPGPNGGIYASSVEDQVRQTMRNLLDGLEEAGLDFSHVVATNVYLDNIDEFAQMNGVYARYFSEGPPPTRTTVAPVAPVERKRTPDGHFPKLEEISLIAVK